MNFNQKLSDIVKKNNSLLCIGLDPDLEKIPKHILKSPEPLFEFNKAIIDATADLVSAYKPNSAFYEAEGVKGLAQLKKTIDYIHDEYSGIPVVLDAKRGDIGNTAKMYAKAAFEIYDADAVTVYPHLGLDSLLPFLEYKDRLTIVLIKTSNPDSGMFQDLPVGNKPYYMAMCDKIKTWDYENLGIFVGATYPKELKTIREIFPNNIFLSAGIGVQEGEVESAVKAGVDSNGTGIMYNASRSIIYASKGTDFADKARNMAIKTRDTINKYR